MLLKQNGAARIAFVTEQKWSALTPDDQLAAGALERAGAHVTAAVWTDPAVDWSSFDAIVLRSCWDYYERATQFIEWLDDLARAGCSLINDAATIRWNLDKRYLADLESAGVRIVPTEFAAPGDSLRDIMERRGWSDAVVKPRISADGHRTARVRAGDAAVRQDALDEAAAGRGALVQQYMPEIEAAGELSFVFLAGTFSHAVLKRPSAAEFRVQPRYGGSTVTAAPSALQVAQAAAVLRALSLPWLYARVDACVQRDRLVLMELELIEPSLYFEHDDGAAGRFAAALMQVAGESCAAG